MYQSYYNLTGKPFRLSPDPGFFFPSRGHKRALAYLRYGLSQNEGFVVITGAPGTGKTTLAQILLEELGDKSVVVAHLTTTQLDADDMLRMVSASFGLRYEGLDKTGLLKNIESFLLARSRERKRALLVIDEAQNLPARSLEELRMLSNLQVGDKALLQTFLLGQNQFRQMLDHQDLEQLRQRVIANFHLGPLAPDENQRYIESRMKLVGWNADPRFAEVAFEKIHTYTEGIPRRINMLCDRILLFGCMEEKHEITGEVVDLVIDELEQEISGNNLSGGDASDSETQTKHGGQARDDNEALKESQPLPTASAPVESGVIEQPKSATPTDASSFSSDDIFLQSDESFDIEIAQADSSENLLENITGNTSKSVSDNKRREPVFTDPEAKQNVSANGARQPEDVDYIEITQDFLDEFDRTYEQDKQENPQASRKSEKKPPAEIKSKQGAKREIGAASNERKEKANAKPEKTEKKDKLSVPESDIDISVDNDVLGNTVKHKNVSEKEDDNKSVNKPAAEAEPMASPISERELFRVIPGGKNNPTPKVESNDAMAPAAHHAPSSEDVVLRRILRLVLAFHRSPSSFPGLDDISQPLPEGVSELLELAVADDQVVTKVSPASVMGISPVMLRAAVRFFVRRTLFANGGDHFRVLGLTPNATQHDIEKHYDLLMRLLRQDKQAGVNECVAMVGLAYETLNRQDNHSEPRITEVDSENNKAAAVLQALENPELTIDFNDDVEPNPKPMPVSAIMGMPHNPNQPDPRVTRRRIHFLGQAAIVGIGGLVFVLGILITQLEPGDTEKESNRSPVGVSKSVSSNPKMVGNADSQSEAQSEKDGKLSLSFNDASSDVMLDRSNDSAASTINKSSSTDKKDEAQVHLVPADSRSTDSKTIQQPVEQEKPKTVVATPKAAPKPAPKPVPQQKSVVSKAEVVPVLPKETSKSTLTKPVPEKTRPVEVKQAKVSAPTPSTPVMPVKPKPATIEKQTVAVRPSNQFQGKDIPLSGNSQSQIASAPAVDPQKAAQSAPGVAGLIEEPVQQKLSITEDGL